MGKAEEHLAFLQIKVCDSSAIVILRERSPALKLAPFPTLSMSEVAHFWVVRIAAITEDCKSSGLTAYNGSSPLLPIVDTAILCKSVLLADACQVLEPDIERKRFCLFNHKSHFYSGSYPVSGSGTACKAVGLDALVGFDSLTAQFS